MFHGHDSETFNIKSSIRFAEYYMMVPMDQESDTLQAVSNPKLVGTSLHFRSPSIVFGQPMTRVFMFFDLWSKFKIRNHNIYYVMKKLKNNNMVQPYKSSVWQWYCNTKTAQHGTRPKTLNSVRSQPKIFWKEAGIGVWIITTNDNKSVQIKLVGCVFSLLELHQQQKELREKILTVKYQLLDID